MAIRTPAERIALFVCLPLLFLVSLATWRLWRHVEELDRSLAESRATEISLLSKIRDAVGREALAGRALQQSMSERDYARNEAAEARAEAEQAKQAAERERLAAERLRDLRNTELDRMRDALGRIAETERTPMGMVMHLGEDAFLFPFDSADLGPDNREILSRIAGVLLASYGFRVSVYGHTDDQGIAKYNVDLSERRATTVRQYLVDAGIPGEIVDSRGFGESSPRVEGRSNEARRKNRRVEIGIVDTVIEYQGQVVEEVPLGAEGVTSAGPGLEP